MAPVACAAPPAAISRSQTGRSERSVHPTPGRGPGGEGARPAASRSRRSRRRRTSASVTPNRILAVHRDRAVDFIARDALEHLRKFGLVKIDVLVAAARNHPDDHRIREIALAELARHGGVAAAGFVELLKANKLWGVHWQILNLLQKLGAPPIAPLAAALGELNPNTREKALKTLEALGWRPRTDTERTLQAQRKKSLSRSRQLQMLLDGSYPKSL